MVAFDEFIVLVFDLSLHKAAGRRERVVGRGFKSEPRVRTRIGILFNLGLGIGSLLLRLPLLLLGSMLGWQKGWNLSSGVLLFGETFEEREREEENGKEGCEEEEENNRIVHLYLWVSLNRE